MRRIATMILLLVQLGACRTPEGPRIALPPQDLHAPVPSGYVRVVVFNSTPELYLVSGHIRIWIGGMTAPSLYLNHYMQLFLSPGTYEFLFESSGFPFGIKDRYKIPISGTETLIKIRAGQMVTRFKLVDELPPDFLSEFVGGRDPAKWPAFPPPIR